MRVSTSYLLNNLTRDIAEQLGRMQKLSEQVSTGKRVRRPSDDPLAASRALAIRALKAGVAQHKASVDYARGWLAATEGALVKTHEVLSDAADIALRGANDALSEDERRALAEEVNGLIHELVGLANTQHDGSYVFGGLRPGTKPFLLIEDPGDPNYPVLYQGADGVKEVKVESGTTIRVNTNGGEAFMQGIAAAGGRNLFQILVDLRDHLLQGDSSPTFESDMAADIAAVDAGCDETLKIVTGIGAKTRRLDRVLARLSENEVELEALLSRTEDADVVRAVTELQLQETVYRAALGAAAGVMRASLLDYLG